jgi:hypothetical protein
MLVERVLSFAVVIYLFDYLEHLNLCTNILLSVTLYPNLGDMSVMLFFLSVIHFDLTTQLISPRICIVIVNSTND